VPAASGAGGISGARRISGAGGLGGGGFGGGMDVMVGLDGDAEDEAGADLALFDGEAAAVRLGDLAGDGEPESGAVDVLVAGGLQPGEALEDDLSVLGGDAGPVVLHLEDGDIVLGPYDHLDL
jgi:hypothetical protein